MMQRFSRNDPDFRAPGGESFGDVRRRGTAAILDIAAKHPGQTVAVFAHGTFLRNTVAEFLNIGPDGMKQLGHSDNTGVTCLEVEGDRISIVYENDNSHLPEEISTLARQKWWKSREGSIADANMWFRPLDLEREEELYLAARHDAWVDIHGEHAPFDGAGFCKDARTCWEQDKEKALTVAMQRDEVAGVLQLDLARFADEGIGYIPFVYMNPQHRKRGLGVQLIGQAVSVFRPLGRTRLRLRCAPENAVAQRFYKKYGFEKVGEEHGSVTLDILEKYIGYETKD